MKFTLSWLKEHLDTDASLDEITEALTDLGLEVEGVENPADRLPFKIGKVLTAEKHPDADKLKLCTVLTEKGEQQIICGAPNARAGIHVVVAQPGDYVPGIDTTIQVGKIRGIESQGMMASERELELSDEHDGIIELPEDAPVGQLFVDYAGLNDPVIDIAITPNRPDALGVAGVARDLAARGLGTLKTPGIETVSGKFESPIKISIEDTNACPAFYGRLVRGVKNGPSPDWLQQRLKAIGLRPISALVDITNYMTFDRNRPLHVFDAKKLKGNLSVKLGQGGAKFLALDEKTYTLDDEMTAVCDESGVVGLGGVMGGEDTGVDENTVDVFIEAALFDPKRTAMTGRKLKINSDARYRFERGVDPEFVAEGMEMATQLVLDLCGGEPSEVVVAGAIPDTARSYTLDPARLISLVGMEIAPEEQKRILEALGFTVSGDGPFEVAVPSWRPDVGGEADLVEEVARVASLSKLVGQPLPRPAGVARPLLTPMQTRLTSARRALAAQGLNEAVTYSFIDQKAAEMFGGGTDATRVANPISSEMSHIRPDLLPGLLAAAARNQARGFADVALFELGPVFAGGEPEDMGTHAGALRVGMTAPRNAHGTRRAVDLFDAKADAEAILTTLGAPVDRLMVMRNAPDWFHPGRSGVLSLGPKNPLAAFGELHPKVLEAFGIKGAAVAVTLYPSNIPFPKTQTATRAKLDAPDLQAVERDFAFVVDADVAVESMIKAAKGADKALIASADVFDVFTGEKAAAQLGENRKSVALSVRLQPRETTLKDADIDAVSQKVVAAVEKATGATLRR
ncbi:phenylalanine--tRNA ligase subunit beta [Paracoccaceae bacterium GXU_MW_L88]